MRTLIQPAQVVGTIHSIKFNSNLYVGILLTHEQIPPDHITD